MNLPIIMSSVEQKQSLPKDFNKQLQETNNQLKVLKEQTVYRTDFRLIWVIYIYIYYYTLQTRTFQRDYIV